MAEVIKPPGFKPIAVNLDKCKDVTCQNVLILNDGPMVCGCTYFTQVYIIKIISPLMTQKPGGDIKPIPTFLCASCGFPIGMKPKQKQGKEKGNGGKGNSESK